MMKSIDQVDAEYWEQRAEDTMELLLETVALMAAICCEVRTDLELLRADRSKRGAEEAGG